MELFEKDIQMGRLQVYCTRGLRPEMCSENVIDWQYLLLGILEQY